MENPKFITKEEIEKARAECVKEDRDYEVKARFAQLNDIDRLIEWLKVNRTHVAGYAIAAIAYEDTAAVDPVSGRASSGLVARCAVNSNYGLILNKKAERFQGDGDRPNLSDMLDDLMKAAEGDE